MIMDYKPPAIREISKALLNQTSNKKSIFFIPAIAYVLITVNLISLLCLHFG